MSPDDDLASAADRLLASFDFARATEASARAHRIEMERLLLGFVEMVDSLDACIELARSSGNGAAFGTTVERIRGRALRVLEEHGVEAVIAIGQPLDLAHSEVVDVRTDETVTHDTVLEEIVRAYLWRGQLLRRARVIISGERPAAADHDVNGRKKGDS